VKSTIHDTKEFILQLMYRNAQPMLSTKRHSHHRNTALPLMKSVTGNKWTGQIKKFGFIIDWNFTYNGKVHVPSPLVCSQQTWTNVSRLI